MRNRLTFALALFGMILTTHMWVQKQSGFEEGCLGVAAQEETVTASGCEEAMTSRSSDILGIDNVLAGFAFYAFLGVLSFAMVFSSGSMAGKLSKAKLGISGVALLISLYLVYLLLFELDAGCVLCMISAVTVSTIFSIELQAFRKNTQGESPAGVDGGVSEFGFFALASFIAAILLFTDLFFINNITGSALRALPENEVRNVVNSVLEERFDARYLTMMAPCEIDDTRELKKDWQSLLDPGDPVMGNPDAKVKVMDIFDPNCPHCKQLHELLKAVVKQYGDRVAFYYKPYPLWDKSINQVEAMWLAYDQRRYFEMIELQFKALRKDGLTDDFLSQLAGSIGLDLARFESDLKSEKYHPKVLAFRERVNAAGITGAPVLLINGKYVGKKGQSLSIECISSLIEQELKASGN